VTLFWILVAVLVGLAFIAPALLRSTTARQDQETGRTEQNVAIARERMAELEAEHAAGALDDADFEQAKRELELNLADELVDERPQQTGGQSRALLLVLVIALPAATVALYQTLGAPEHMQIAGPGGSVSTSDPHAAQGEAPSVEELTARLEQRLAENPNNADGWFMLGRTKMSLGRYAEAADAFEKTLELVGEHPSILIALADSVAMTQSGRISGRPAELVQRALAVSPDDVTALWLAGQAAEEQGDAAGALKYWRKAEAGLQDQPQLLAELRGMIAQVERDSGIESAPIEAAGAAGPSLELDVSLAPELAGRVEPADTVFIFARAEQGPPMPVAAAKLRVGDLPAKVTLNDSMAMMPQMKLSLFEKVKVGARISRSGQPVAKSGDLESETRLVDVGNAVKLELRIDREVP
jgi:cytochrome c-type biogenesis protein CcmH